jgi:hypothetical protein
VQLLTKTGTIIIIEVAIDWFNIVKNGIGGRVGEICPLKVSTFLT